MPSDFGVSLARAIHVIWYRVGGNGWMLPHQWEQGARVVNSSEERRQWSTPEVEPGVSKVGGEHQAPGGPRSGSIPVREEEEYTEEGKGARWVESERLGLGKGEGKRVKPLGFRDGQGLYLVSFARQRNSSSFVRIHRSIVQHLIGFCVGRL